MSTKNPNSIWEHRHEAVDAHLGAGSGLDQRHAVSFHRTANRRTEGEG